jgi:flagellar basal-body rod protein FlgF
LGKTLQSGLARIVLTTFASKGLFMDNGLYVTLSRQLALFRDLNVTANNIANVNTVGYNAEHIVFDSYITKDRNQKVENPLNFANGVGTYRDTRGGPMQTTGNQLDVAIKGNGYFAVETPLGTRYTRAGNFQIGGDGSLVNANGYPVLDPSNQRIIFPDNVRAVEIGTLGNIKVNGDDFGQLGINQFEHEQLLEPAGNGLFKAETAPRAAEGVTVVQGMLESSNVQSVIELTHLIKVSRAFTETTNYVSAIYDLQRKASNTWAQQG